MKKTLLKGALMGFGAVFIAASFAQADITIYYGLEGGSGDVDNVLFSDGDDDDSVAKNTVDGWLNSDHSILVDFESPTLLLTPSGGQARITAFDYETGGTFTHLEFYLDPSALPLDGFDKVQFNIDAEEDGSVDLTFVDNLGQDWSGTFDLDDTGQNFFTAIAINDQQIVRVIMDTTVGISEINDLAQVRLNPTEGEPPPPPVPEPATMLLFGTGLAGLAGVRRRMSKQ